VTTILEAFAWWLSGRTPDEIWDDYPEDPPEDWRTRWYFTSQVAWEAWALRTGAFAGRDYDDEYPGPGRFVMFLLTLREFVWAWVTSTFHPLFVDYCAKFGHHMIDDGSWCTPDTGGEAHRCTRCHESWSHTYY